MACTVTANGPSHRTLNFTVERAEIKKEIHHDLTAIAARATFKGFRQGKAPMDLVRKAHEHSVVEDVRKRIISREFQKAVEEHELRPVGDPEMNLEAFEDDEAGDFTFEFKIEVIPEFELADLDKIPVTVSLPAVTDDMVDQDVKRFCEQAATLEDADEGALIERDDILHATIVYQVGEDALEPRTECAVLPRHDLVDGLTIEGSADALVGKRTGDTVQLEAALPSHFRPDEFAGQQATLEVTIDKHQVMAIPELDEELLKRAGVENEEELREKIREGIENQRSRAKDELADQSITKWLIEHHEFELPERLVAKSIDRRIHEIAHRMMEQEGLEAEESHVKAEEHREEVQESTQSSLKASFILARIASEHDLSATEEETLEQIRALASARGHDPQEFLSHARKEGWIGDMMAQITEQKTRDWLREQAQITVEESEETPEAA